VTVQSHWPQPANEPARLAALRGLGVLDSPPDEELDALTRLASHICGTPTAVLNLIDADRQWQASAHGVPRGEVSRDDSMCAYSILSREVTYTPDASLEAVFAESPFVSGAIDKVRLYVSAPLVVGGDKVVGTLCAFDTKAVTLSREQIERLRDLAGVTVRILELRRSAGEMAQAATRDPLTGLPNRTLLVESMTRAFARRDRALTEPAVLFVDLDGSKKVNDTHGHAAGDTVLREVAQRLVRAVRASDLVSRLGGDEFVVLVERSPDEAAGGLPQLVHRLREAVTSPIGLPGGSVQVGASIGIAVPAGPEETPDTLLARADAAMYAEKGRPAGR
jgi:diguanylate cyclase (GGDEF)-like protein